MPESSALPLQVVEAITCGWVVVTANQRAARTLRHGFDLGEQAAGAQSWQPAQVFAWETWLDSLHRGMVLGGRATDLLLNRSQEHTLWRTIVAQDAHTSSLRPLDALAEAAASAWALLHAYDARERLRRYPGNSDTEVFARWAAEFDRTLRRGAYMTAAQLPRRLTEAARADSLSLPTGLLLAGFETKTPAQELLLQQITAQGVRVEVLSQSAQAPSRQLAALPSERDELTDCAHWVRSHLERRPDARVAVIVPAIDSVRADIEREFRAVLAPELNDIAAPTAAAPFEFSLGVPLAHTALAATALDILRWGAGALPLERISALLLSPYFAAGPAERLARAEFDAFVLRRQRLLEPRLRVDALHRILLKTAASGTMPVLMSCVAALRSACGAPELLMLAYHGEWAERMADMLDAAGWAPAAQLDSIEMQTRRKWQSALDELSALDFNDRLVPYSQALESLEQIARRTMFAPESRHAPVQIMGPLEAAGSEFDAIWFLRANDVEWSTTTSSNPLLPWRMQRDLNMPGAVPANDAKLARAIAQRIAASAPEVVFSYARTSADGPQRPSPALTPLELTLYEVRADAGVTPPRITPERVIEPAIPAPPTEVHGGVRVLEWQAACAFRAFAEARLFATSPEPVVLGLDARERGSIVHAVMQLFWTRVPSQAALRQMSNPDRDATLDTCIEEAVRERVRSPEPGWGAAYVDTERQRLRNLLRPWLEFEAQKRSAFEVKAVEEKRDAKIGPLHLTVKVDRVDTWLRDGEPAGDIILDYKSGKPEPADWMGERPDAPQIPLYAILGKPDELAAVAFASISPGRNRGIRGFARESGVLIQKSPRSAPASLPGQVAEWSRILERLAEEFHAGRTDVRPKSYPETCRYCGQRLLCRLDVAALSADETEDQEESSEEEYG